MRIILKITDNFRANTLVVEPDSESHSQNRVQNFFAKVLTEICRICRVVLK